MVYETCPMFGGSYGLGGFYLNWIFAAAVFAFIFWGVYYLVIKNKTNGGKRK